MAGESTPRKAPTLSVLLLILIAVGMDVAVQLLYKSGINHMRGFSGSPFNVWVLATFAWNALHHWRVWLGIGVSCAQVAVWWGVLSRVDLSFAFPLMSLSYIILLAASHWLLHEHISTHRWLGTIAIVFGVYLITRPSPQSRGGNSNRS